MRWLLFPLVRPVRTDHCGREAAVCLVLPRRRTLAQPRCVAAAHSLHRAYMSWHFSFSRALRFTLSQLKSLPLFCIWRLFSSLNSTNVSASSPVMLTASNCDKSGGAGFYICLPAGGIHEDSRLFYLITVYLVCSMQVCKFSICYTWTSLEGAIWFVCHLGILGNTPSNMGYCIHRMPVLS